MEENENLKIKEIIKQLKLEILEKELNYNDEEDVDD